VIAEITPPPSEGHRPVARRHIGFRTMAYGFGLIASATAVGAAAGALGLALRLSYSAHARTPWVVAIAAIALAYGAHELSIIRLPMPQVRWQVPARWARYGKGKQVVLYGVILGADVFTFIPYAAFYVLLLIESTIGVNEGAKLGLAYGLARLCATTAGIITSCRYGSALLVARKIWGATNAFHRATGITLVIVGGFLMGLSPYPGRSDVWYSPQATRVEANR